MEVAVSSRHLVPQGPEPYAPVDAFDPDNDATSLPYDAWGMAIFLPLGLPLSEDLPTNVVRFMLFHLPNYVLLAVTIVVQFVFLENLISLAAEAEAEDEHDNGSVCNGASMDLQLSCLLVLVGSILSNELKWTVDVIKWLSRVPMYDKAKHDSIWDNRRRKQAFSGWTQPFMVVRTRIDGVQRVLAATGLSMKYRIVCTITVILPKATLAAFVAHYSAGFILNAPDSSEIILNAVATLFILEVSNVLTRLCMPRTLREAFDALPPIHRDPAMGNEFESLANTLGAYPIMVLTGLLCCIEYSFWCKLMNIIDTGTNAELVIAVCVGIVVFGVCSCGWCFCCCREADRRRSVSVSPHGATASRPMWQQPKTFTGAIQPSVGNQQTSLGNGNRKPADGTPVVPLESLLPGLQTIGKPLSSAPPPPPPARGASPRSPREHGKGAHLPHGGSKQRLSPRPRGEAENDSRSGSKQRLSPQGRVENDVLARFGHLETSDEKKEKKDRKDKKDKKEDKEKDLPRGPRRPRDRRG